MKQGSLLTQRLRRACVLSLILFACISAARAQTSAFTYQGRLTDASATANGAYDFQFAVYDAASGGTLIATNSTATTGITLTGGVFTAQLDFGAAAFPGADRYLEIRVKKPADASYATLSPRQQITSAPYAIRAMNATNVETTGGNSVVNSINNGATNTTINSNRLSPDVVRLNPGATQSVTTTDPTAALLDASGTTTDKNSNVIAASRFRLNLDSGFYISGLYLPDLQESGSVPTSGAGVRMMWYPGKSAFRAGRVDEAFSTNWNEENIGFASFAFGRGPIASGVDSIAFGNRAWALSNFSTAIGQLTKAFGTGSIAIGKYATTCQVANCGSSVFYNGAVSISDACADFLSEGLTASANNQINMRGCGGYRFFTNQNLTAGVQLAPGSGSWSSLSDRNVKENFAAVDTRNILQKVLNLPMKTWNYKSQDASIRHIGVIAQDFKAAFGVGESDRMITTIDADGVALAAIQGLNEELKDRDAKIEEQQKALNDLQEQVKRQEAELDGLKKLLCAQNPQAGICREEKQK